MRKLVNVRMVSIYVDADACPVKDEIERVAMRHGTKVYLVSDGGIRPSQNPLVELVIVDPGTDAADDWIATHIEEADVCVTNDIPLAAVLKHNGDGFNEESIGMALANREIMRTLRETGEITGGPRPFGKQDRSRFLDKLETTLQSAKRRS